MYPADKKSPNGKLRYILPFHPLLWLISFVAYYNFYIFISFSNFSSNSVLYEVFPMSYLMEQAGGQAFTGKLRVFKY